MIETDLIDSIDSAAARLLEMAGFGAKTDEAAVSLAIVLTSEQVRAFDAVVEWAKIRKDLRPPEKGKSRFDGIRSSFNGQTRKRRGSPISPEAEPDPAEPVGIVGDDVEPAVNSVDTGIAVDLFDA